MSASEFPRPVAVARLKAEGNAIAIEAGPEEREAVRARLGLEGLDRLSAELTLQPLGAGLVAARGSLRAEVRQVCVVTLEPFAATLTAPVRLVFRPVRPGEETAEVELDPEAEDEVLYAGPDIDVGEAVVETLALALHPWPRRPGATFTWSEQDEKQDDRQSPFAVLKRRRDSGGEP